MSSSVLQNGGHFCKRGTDIRYPSKETNDRICVAYPKGKECQNPISPLSCGVDDKYYCWRHMQFPNVSDCAVDIALNKGLTPKQIKGLNYENLYQKLGIYPYDRHCKKTGKQAKRKDKQAKRKDKQAKRKEKQAKEKEKQAKEKEKQAKEKEKQTKGKKKQTRVKKYLSYNNFGPSSDFSSEIDDSEYFDESEFSDYSKSEDDLITSHVSGTSFLGKRSNNFRLPNKRQRTKKSTACVIIIDSDSD